MSLDAAKLLEDLKATAKPELEALAEQLREKFMKDIDEFVDSSRAGKLDDLLKKAAGYEVNAITEPNRAKAEQYAEAAEDVLRQIRLVLIAEQIVASREIAAMIEAAAISIWDGFKTVASSLLGMAVKAVVSGVLGPAGGAIADAAGSFLEDTIGGGEDDASDSQEPQGEDNG